MHDKAFGITRSLVCYAVFNQILCVSVLLQLVVDLLLGVGECRLDV